MPFVSKNVSVSKTSGAFSNLTYLNPKTQKNQSVTFRLKDCYSHFGVKPDKYGSFSLGVNLDDQRQIKNFKAVEKRCGVLSPETVVQGRLLNCFYENGNYTTLYLKLDKDDLGSMKPGKTCLFNGMITFSAIYLGDEEKGYLPKILVQTTDAKLTPTKKHTKTKDTVDDPIDESDEE